MDQREQQSSYRVLRTALLKAIDSVLKLPVSKTVFSTRLLLHQEGLRPLLMPDMQLSIVRLVLHCRQGRSRFPKH